MLTSTFSRQLQLALHGFRKCSIWGCDTVCPSNSPRQRTQPSVTIATPELSQASYLQTGSAPGWPCFLGELVTSLFESLRRQFPREERLRTCEETPAKDDWIVSRLQVSGVGWLLVCRKRPFSKLRQKESVDSNSERSFYVNVSKESWLPWKERWLTLVTR